MGRPSLRTASFAWTVALATALATACEAPVSDPLGPVVDPVVDPAAAPAAYVAADLLLPEEPPVFLTQWGTLGSGPGEFDYPVGIAVDPAGFVYVADGNNQRIQKFDADGGFVAMWGTPGTGPGEFSDPGGVEVDADGYVYVVDRGNHRVQKFAADGSFITAFGENGSADGQLNWPTEIAIDDAGGVYVTDGNHRVNKYDTEGSFLRSWGWGVQDLSPEFQVCISGCEAGIPGPGDGQFQGPWGIDVDRFGNVFVSDYANHRVQKFDAQGSFLLAWYEFGRDNPDHLPRGVAVDDAGAVFVTIDGQWVDKFDGVGNLLTTWGGYGSDVGQFRQHWGVAVDDRGNVYVADTENHRVQKFGPPAVPFSALDVKLKVHPRWFDINGTFVLGEGSDGVVPPEESVRLSVGSYAVELPPGSFVERRNAWVFRGCADGVEMDVDIRRGPHGTYWLKARADGVDLTGEGNPVTVELSIGDDVGSAEVMAKIHRR